MTDLRGQYRARVRDVTRGASNELVDLACEQRVLTARLVERRLGISRPVAINALRQLEQLGVLAEAGEGPRRQLRFRAHEILTALTHEN